MPRKRKVTPSKATSSKKQKPIEESKIVSDSAEADSTTAAATSPVKSASSSPTNSNRKEVVAVVDEEADSITEPTRHKQTDDDNDEASEARFLGEPLPDAEARQRWPKRYEDKKGKKVVASRNSKEKDDSDEIIPARCHYTRAEVDGYVYDLYDDAYVKGEDGEDNFIGRIIEMFESVDGTLYFTAQWFYRARDTVINKLDHLIDNKRVFFSEIRDDNPLECLVEKLNIVRVQLNADLDAKKATIPPCDYFYDTLYLLPYSSFVNLPPECKRVDSGTSSTISSDVEANGTSGVKFYDGEVSQVREHHKSKLTLLDLYSGCGAMSTGLCLGANMSGVYLETRWAVDLNKYACESLRLNHPETEVRNESVEDFLLLLKEWEKLCKTFSLVKSSDPQEQYYSFDLEDDEGDNEDEDDNNDDAEVFEVEKILGICYGVPKEKGKRGLHFKVRWKNYGEDEDTWEPVEGLGNCRERIREFIMDGYKSKILPLTGDVDVICGGPPCQGVSGFNRFRNKANPLNDEKNKQLVVFMEVVEYLQPRFVLMENVVDLVKFAHGFLGRYALGRLVQMNYQVRMGLMAAGAYGLPQFRMRCFLWGARPTEKLPQYPLPTHDVVVRGVIPLQFEINTVAYDEGHTRPLEKKLLLEDAISDLPPVENNEHRDELPYYRDPKTQFQRFIRLRKDEMFGSPSKLKPTKQMLYDHRPLQLNKDDYERVCNIPKNKGANFRDLPGVRVRPDNKVEWDPNVERVLLKSGKPLVPDYAMSFVQGSSSKPFARLWWDETVPTVVTRAEPHNQAILHPVQDRVLSVRENARLQGFPDYYKLCGPIKERYIQVGNAVAVPVARALGYALGLAFQGTAGDDPLFTLPSGFPNVLEQLYSASSEDGA